MILPRFTGGRFGGVPATGRIRVALPPGAQVVVDPPINVEVELAETRIAPTDLADQIAATIRSRLIFRAAVTLIPQSAFGDAGYKTQPIVRKEV